MYQTGEVPTEVMGLQGPAHPELGIAMDMTIGLKTESGKLCTLSLSFNNDGPFGSFFRYIGDNGTYLARYENNREPNSSFAQGLAVMQVMQQLEDQMGVMKV